MPEPIEQPPEPLTTAQREELDRRLDDRASEASPNIPWEQFVEALRSRARDL